MLLVHNSLLESLFCVLLLNSVFRTLCLPPFRKKTVMSNERIENLQSNMQFPLTRLPKIVLRRVEEELPIWREIVVSAMCLCADQRICMAQTRKCLLGILCYLSFSMVSYFKYDFLFP